MVVSADSPASPDYNYKHSTAFKLSEQGSVTVISQLYTDDKRKESHIGSQSMVDTFDFV